MIRLASVLFAATAIALAGCDGGNQTAADGFKPVPVTPVLGDVPMGSDSATVTVLEYASFACSHCRDFWKQDFPRFKAAYIDTGKVKYIYRDFPIDNDLSIMLASVSRCKGSDVYYDMVDDIFSHQFEIFDAARGGGAGPVIAAIGERHGATTDEIRTCIDHTPALTAAIEKSREEGTARGVNSTPTVFINDVRAEDHTFDGLAKAIDAKLGATPAAPPAPAAPATPTEGAPASAPGQ